VGFVVFVGMIHFPQTEGRAANLDLISIYADPFIIYIYLASIPFFVALFQAFKLLGLIEKNKTFTKAAVKAARNIKYCAILLVCGIIGAVALVLLTSQEDNAGFVAIGIYVTFATIVVAAAASVFEKLLSTKKQ